MSNNLIASRLSKEHLVYDIKGNLDYDPRIFSLKRGVTRVGMLFSKNKIHPSSNFSHNYHFVTSR
jgi:hypothetical protein